MAWKDEAFELWRQWANLYDAASPSHKIVSQVASNWFLVNMVDNNFKSNFALFDILDAVKTELKSEIGH